MIFPTTGLRLLFQRKSTSEQLLETEREEKSEPALSRCLTTYKQDMTWSLFCEKMQSRQNRQRLQTK